MVTLSSGECNKTIVQDGVAKCPDCGSTDPMMGACPIGAMTVHQEYVCNVYQNEFKALWAATMTTSGVATFILAGSEESEAA
jgi:hypothetical protein